MLGQSWNRIPRAASIMDLDPSQSQLPGLTQDYDHGAPPPHYQLKAPRNPGHILSPYSTLSTISDEGSEYAESVEGRWSGRSTQGPESTSRIQRSYSSNMSFEETVDEPGTRSSTPVPTQLAGQNPNVVRHRTLARGRTIRKEDTLMVIDSTQGPTPEEAAVREVHALLEPRLQSMLADKFHRDHELLSKFTDSIRLQMMEEFSETRLEIARLRQEVLDLRVQVEKLRNRRSSSRM